MGERITGRPFPNMGLKDDVMHEWKPGRFRHQHPVLSSCSSGPFRTPLLKSISINKNEIFPNLFDAIFPKFPHF